MNDPNPLRAMGPRALTSALVWGMAALMTGTAVAARLSLSANPAAGGTVYIYNNDTGAESGPAATAADTNTVAGNLILVTASPAAGYIFRQWTAIPAAIPGLAILNPSTTFNAPAANRILRADFIQGALFTVGVSDPALGDVRFQNLTTGVDSGFVDTFQNLAALNDQLTVRAVAAPGCVFAGWSGTIDPSIAGRNPVSIVANGQPAGIVALFYANDADTDGDGITDGYEIQNGLNVTNGLDAGFDFDGDGLSNIQEFNGPFGFAQTRAGVADTDADGMWDGWEAYFGVDPNDPTGDNGPIGNTDGDEVFSVALGTPIRPFTNQEEYNFFITEHGGPGITSNGLSAALGIAGLPGQATKPTPAGVGAPAVQIVNGFDTDTDTLPDGWEYTYTLSPISATGEDGAQGNPDADMNYNTAANNVNAGLPINPWSNLEEYNRYLGVDGASTDPTNPDSDSDQMPDGWEQDFGLDALSAAGADGSDGNPDGDVVFGADGGCNGNPYSNLAEFNASGTSIRGATHNPTNPDIDGDRMPDHWELTFAYDAWYADTDANGTTDANENPDGDFMADDGAGIHVEVLLANGYDPRTSYVGGYDDVWWFPARPYNNAAPNTRGYSNIDELYGLAALGGAIPGVTACTPGTHPRNRDTDADGIFDGWEYYVGLNARSFNPQDAGVDSDADGLINLREFQCYEVGYGANAGWQNKIWPADPFDPDTDSDQLADGLESVVFNYSGGTAAFGRNCYVGGGLNPCSADTDGDHIPDAWEHSFRYTFRGGGTITNILTDLITGQVTTNLVAGRNGMDGTQRDASPEEPAHIDYDRDGLDNYQEYWSASVYHWQYPDWAPGLGFGGYDAFDFYTGQPYQWDWQYWADVVPLLLSAPDVGGVGTPWNYIEGIPYPTRVWFSSTDPNDWDSDLDEMDDYWETYHGLNPIFGGLDLYESKLNGAYTLSLLPVSMDPRINPYFAGHPFSDPDQDGLPNSQEALIPNLGPPDYYHTDPSPMWFTDSSYQLSFPNLYYMQGTVPWYWSADTLGAPPLYVYTHEHNEGYDTDNDNLGDRGELVNSTIPGSTDPLSAESPIKRRALYLSGNAAARTRVQFSHDPVTFEQFTIEAWVRPQNPASGQDQVIMERLSEVPNGNIMGWPDGLRLNFQIGLNPAGLPYVAYNGGGFDVIFVRAQAPAARALPANQWTHLAGVYDAVAKKLFLYMNGDLVATTPSAERPFNGYILPYLFAGPLVVGAHDANPAGIVSGESIFGPIAIADQPALQNYFQGWVDEVRVWDGARAQAAIRSTMTRTLKRANVIASEATTTPLRYLFNFDELPDPDHNPVSPDGFSLLNGRPNDGSYPGIPWWRTAQDRSVVYNDYLYLPWIENSGTRRPLNTPHDTGYWAMNSTGGQAASNDFPNTANPYNFYYLHNVNAGGESFENVFNDLLPLRFAVADEDVELWDGLGAGVDPFDTDDDGLPDDWETRYGLDPEGSSGDNGPDGDPDGDGLSNWYEFLAGTDPYATDSDGNGISDANDDADGDRLTNLQEQSYGTKANVVDTDDDGLTDFEEATGTDDPLLTIARTPEGYSDPVNSIDPPQQRSMSFDGASKLVVPPQDKLMSTAWTVQMWANPTSSPAVGVDGVLVSRYVADLVTGEYGVNYELGVTGTGDPDAVMPYARYRTKDGTEIRVTLTNGVTPGCAAGIPLNQWTHLAATYEPSNHLLRLYVDGDMVAYRPDATPAPPILFGPGSIHLGDEVTLGTLRSTPGDYTGAYMGYIDEVKIYQLALDADTIQGTFMSPGKFTAVSGALTMPLKSGPFQPDPGMSADLSALGLDTPVHAMVQFTAGSQASHAQQLLAAGLTAKYRISDRAYAVSGTRRQIQALPGRRWAGLVPPEAKIASKLKNLSITDGQWVAVQFYPDTPVITALAAVQGAGATPRTNRYFSSTYMLVRATEAQRNSLAASDVVSFVMPTAPYMFNATVKAFDCFHGGLEQAPYAVQGVGWDGPGLGSADLLYHFANGTPDLEGENEIQADQMKKWAAVAALTFTETPSANQDFSLDVLYGAGEHGDGYPFDGPSGVLAHGFFPNDINPEPIAGDLHFDEDETWVNRPTSGANGEFDLRFVSLHELGHCLGMGHSEDATAIMAPFYQPNVEPDLQPDDIAGILTLYGAQILADTDLRANFRFDDDGVTAEDFAVNKDWLNNWEHAGVLLGNAAFVTNVPPLDADSDGDGMPDWWEVSYGLKPQIDDGGEDIDGDGLYNVTEYKARTSPLRTDTDLDGISDFNDDTDGDALSNGSEQGNVNYPSHPGLMDSDDDELDDSAEVVQGTKPLDPISPFVLRALEFGAKGGTGVVTIADRIVGRPSHRFDMAPWTVECLVQPSTGLVLAADAEVSLVSRTIECLGLKQFELGLRGVAGPGGVALVPFVRVHGSGGTNTEVEIGGLPIAPDAWAHLAARFDTNRVITLLMDGMPVRSDNTGFDVIAGVGDVQVAGDGFMGKIKELRLWEIARTDVEVLLFRNRTLFFDKSAADVGLLRTTGDGGHLRQAATTAGSLGKIDGLEAWSLETWVKTTESGGFLVARSVGSDTDNEQDFNYAMGLDAEGRLFGRFSIDWTAVCFEGANVTFSFGTDHDVNTIVGAMPVNDGQWHHVAYVRDENTAYLYVDGELDATQPGFFTPDPGGNCFIIDATVRTFEGPMIHGKNLAADLDEIRVWRRALPFAELQTVRTHNLLGNELGLVSYFNFDLQRGKNADERSVLRDNSQEYGRYIPGAELVRGANAPLSINPLWVYQGVALAGYYSADDGGTWLEDFMHAGEAAYGGRLENDVHFVAITNLPSHTGDSDGDTLPDSWETLHGLDPGSAVGDNGLWGDIDHDGLNNRAEFLAGTDPRDADTDGNGYVDFDSTNSVGAIYGDIFTDGDFMDDAWETQYPTVLSPLLYDGAEDPDNDGWDNFNEFRADSDPSDNTSFPQPVVNLRVKYNGTNFNGTLRFEAFNHAGMDGIPSARGTIVRSGTASNALPFDGRFVISFGHLRQGANYVFAFVDANNNNTFDTGEPAGVAQNQPVTLGSFGTLDMEIGLTDDQMGMHRFSWVPVAGANDFTVRIVRTTSGGVPEILVRALQGRSYFHEGDYRYSGAGGGLDAGGSGNPGYRANISGGLTTNTWSHNWLSGLDPTRILSPIGQVVYSRNEFVWTGDMETVSSSVEIRKGSNTGAVVYSGSVVTPFRESDGSYRLDIDRYAGDTGFTNGTYYWRVSSFNPLQSSISPWQSFSVDLQVSPTGAFSVAGTLSYFGKVTNASFVIQAFNNRGYGGMPEAQLSLPVKGAFVLRGLRAGTYYVRAFMDQNGNKRLDPAESYGVIKTVLSTEAPIEPRPLTVPGNIAGTYIVVRDRDTDNDQIPDAWETANFGNITTAGFGPLFGYTDSDNDTLNDFLEYSLTAQDTDPNNPDHDGDGLIDGAEYYIYGTDPMRTDTDGDGLSDGAEVAAGSSPLLKDTDGDGVTDNLEVSAGSSPMTADTDGDGFSDLLEIVAGTSTTNAAVRPSTLNPLKLVSLDGAGQSPVRVGYALDPSLTGLAVTVQVMLNTTTNLLLPAWQNTGLAPQLVAPAHSAAGPWVFTNAPGGANTRFYQLQWKLP